MMFFLIGLLISIPSYAMAQQSGIVEPITAQPLDTREIITAVFLTMIIICGLIAFFINKHAKSGPLTARTLMGFVMICVFIAAIALVFLLATAYGESPIFGVSFLIFMLGLFKLMNQFEINR